MFMHIHFRKSALQCLLCCCLIGLLNTSSAQVYIPDHQQQTLFKFKTGVNISYFEEYWKTDKELLRHFPELLAKVNLAAKLGFTTVRLPVSFDLFLEKDGVTLEKKLVEELAQVYQLIEAKNLNLIITYHYGKLYKVANKKAEADRIADMWKQIIRTFKGKGYDQLYFGLYNEPRIAAEDWNLSSKQLITVLRKEDADRFWIVGGTNFNGIDALIDLNLIPNDKKIIYTFHFYQPYIFTHQGAPWDPQKTSIVGLPYPYNAAEMPTMPENADKDTRYNYSHYAERGNKAFIDMRIKKVYDWLVANKVPILCTEVGAINTIKSAHRNSYMKDVVEVMGKYAIPMLVWDLDQTFSIVKGEEKTLPAVDEWIKSF